MASLAEGLAAVIAEATQDECAPDHQFMAFPGFFWPVKAEGLAGGNEPAAFEFTHWVNMIPGKPPLFMMNGRFVWNEYRAILDSHKVSSAEASFASRFARAATEMDLGLVTTALNTYFPVDVVQSPWTNAALGEAQIGNAQGNLTESAVKFMERFNTLSALGDALVASITYERATLVILRGWFDESLLAERFWDVPGTVISDGLDPPSGELPAVVAKLVMIRNLRIHLPAQSLPDVGPEVIFRRVDGESARGGRRAADTDSHSIGADHHCSTAGTGPGCGGSPGREHAWGGRGTTRSRRVRFAIGGSEVSRTPALRHRRGRSGHRGRTGTRSGRTGFSRIDSRRSAHQDRTVGRRARRSSTLERSIRNQLSQSDEICTGVKSHQFATEPAVGR